MLDLFSMSAPGMHVCGLFCTYSALLCIFAIIAAAAVAAVMIVQIDSYMQILLAVALRPKKTKQLRRYWNISHWTLGRAALLLGIANIFIGMYISSVAYKNIIAQAVVLGGLFILYMLKRDVDYLRVPVVPAEEERLLSEAYGHGMCSVLPCA